MSLWRFLSGLFHSLFFFFEYLYHAIILPLLVCLFYFVWIHLVSSIWRQKPAVLTNVNVWQQFQRRVFYIFFICDKTQRNWHAPSSLTTTPGYLCNFFSQVYGWSYVVEQKNLSASNFNIYFCCLYSLSACMLLTLNEHFNIFIKF